MRLACFFWVAIESLHYWGRIRRRVRIGLAEPLVTNRFLLWGSWASLGVGPGSFFGMFAALTLFLAFFPTAAYRRWVIGTPEQVD